MFKKILTLMVLFICASASLAEAVKNDIKLIEKNIPKLHSVKCRFVQYRTIGQNTVKSSGDFQFIEGKGIVFNTTYPVKTTTVYTSQNNKFINDVILAVSTKNFSSVAKQFDINYEKKDENWEIHLFSKADKVKNYIEAVKIFGKNDAISQIKIWQVNPSAVTDIQFHYGE